MGEILEALSDQIAPRDESPFTPHPSILARIGRHSDSRGGYNCRIRRTRVWRSISS
jgi:hypothetical protein